MIKQYLKKLIKEVLEKDGIESLKIGQHTAYVRNDKVHVSAATPKLQLQGTEGSAMNLSLRENAGVIELYDETAAVVRASWSGSTGRRITPLIINSELATAAAIALSKLATGALPTDITIASANIVDGTIVRADMSAPAGSKSIVKEGVTIAAAAGATNEYIIAPEAGSLASIEINPLVALAANDTNYITWTVVNLGQAGAGSTAMLAVVNANTTKSTGGTALAINTKRTLTIHGTPANLVVAQGDKIKIVATVTGTLANTVTVPVYILRFSGTT